ncbi:MAG: hypothetical protein ACR2LR_20600 [Hassallia sp.]
MCDTAKTTICVLERKILSAIAFLFESMECDRLKHRTVSWIIEISVPSTKPIHDRGTRTSR